MAPGSSDIRTYLGQERSLRAGRVGLPGLLQGVLAATAPLTGVAAVMPVAFGVTGIAGQPLLYGLVGVVLALFGAGYAEMGRHVHNAGAFHACVARGLGGTAGAAAGLVALVSYSALQAGVYGLLGFEVSGLLARYAHMTVPWWAGSFAAVALVAVLGRMKICLNAKVFGVLLLAEVALVLAADATEVARPAAGGVSFHAFDPATLTGPGLGAALTFCVAAFAGFEQAPVHAEETKRPGVVVARTMYVAIAFAAVFLVIGAWAMTVAAGPSHVVGLAGRHGTGLLFTLVRPRLGATFADVLTCCYVTGLIAALLGLHNVVARYAFTMGREGLLPAALGRTARRGGASPLGSLLQTLAAAAVVALFAFAFTGHRPDGDPTVPVLHLFTWAAGVGALGVTLLMAAASAAVIVFFARRGAARFHPWRLLAAAAACVALLAVAVLTVEGFATLPGAGPHTPLGWILPGVIGAPALLGLVVGLILKRARPAVHDSIGLGNEAFQLDKAASA